MYTALMIDVRESRDYYQVRRQSIQEFMLELSQTLNRIFAPGLIRNVDIFGGDEVQGLFRCPEAAYLYYRYFALLMNSVGVRAGIGVGAWDVKLEGRGSGAQDGSAYHRARDAIRAVKDSEVYGILFCSGDRMDSVLNSLIGTCAAMTGRMSASQQELLLLTEIFSPLTIHSVMEPEALGSIFGLLRRRECLLGPWDNGSFREPPKLPKDISITPVDVTARAGELYNNGGRVRGVPSRIAESLDISRQSVDRTMKNTGIYSVRDLSISALRFMTAMPRWHESDGKEA